MVEGGLTPAQAVVAATGDAAKAMGIGSLVGTLEPGREADLLVVDGRPDEEVTDVAKAVAVFKAGRQVR